ncbi:hypothetical protein Scep_021174 [Stephania cephalantha]|uniref:Fe-S metabolism associated domain-containing protein n=1 Tax=Stephania cephalantha TaxID=152367 RepID=A0AAP0F5L9_9MAGN
MWLTAAPQSCQLPIRIPRKPSALFSHRRSCPGALLDAHPKISVSMKTRRIASEFESLGEPIERVKRLLDYAARLPRFDEAERVESNRVQGCAVQVWLAVRMSECGTMRFSADSDSEITKGFCSCLVWIMDGADPEEVLVVGVGDLEALNVGEHGRLQRRTSSSRSRVNTWHNVLIDMQKRTKVVVAEAEGKPVFGPFVRDRAPHPVNHGCPHHHHRVAAVVNESDPSQPADDAPEVVATVAVPERCLLRSPCGFPTSSARKPRTVQAFEQLH